MEESGKRAQEAEVIPLFPALQIQERVEELAARINKDYKDCKEGEFLAVGLLKGSFMFFADLVRLIRIPLAVDFIVTSSYVDTESSGNVSVHYEMRAPLANRHILLIEDIVDTGITLSHIRERLLRRSPASIRICALLDKKERRVVEVPIDYLGFDIPDEFVVGYGIDYNERYRNLPFVGVLRKPA